MTTFALIHGGNHVGRHWDRFRPLLEQRGHRTIAPDVPMDQVGAGASDWADVVIDALRDIDAQDDIILVGHSLAGLVLPVIASRIPVRRMVFLCGLVPVPGMSWSEYLAEHPSASTGPSEPAILDKQGRVVVPWDVVRKWYYQDCDLEEAKAAYELVVPYARTSLNEKCPVDTWPDVLSTYILCQDDRLIGPAWSRQVAIDRLGGPAIELPGSHSPMLSRRGQLATVLDKIAAE